MAGKPRTAAKITEGQATAEAAAKAFDDQPDVTPDPELSPEEYMKHRQEVLDRLPAEAERPKNIYARLAQINGLIGLIRKSGVNAFHKYTYAKESDLVEEIRPMLADYGIWIEQGLANDDGLVPHERRGQFKSRDNVTVESLTIITKKFRFVWWNEDGHDAASELPGRLETTEWVYWMGYGDDTGDKGYYKAETGAVKYFLMKTFMVATGNDPEADSKVDERASRRDAGPVEVRSTGRRPAAPGGRQQQTSSPQRRQIGELLRAQGITSSVDAIKKLEEVTGDTIPVADPEDINGALAAYLDSLTGDKAGEIVQKLRPAETDKPTEDETATPDPDAKGWSDAPGPGDDADDGSIDSSIA